MRKRSRIRNLSLCLGGFAVAGVVRQAHAITVNGTLDPAFGSAITTQTIQTGFGVSNDTGSPGPDASGSELDAAYGTIQNNTLYLFFAGDLQDNGNCMNIFIADQRAGGQSVLNTNVNPLNAMNGSAFSPGFKATYAINMNDFSGTMYTDRVDLTTGNGGYDGSVGLSGGIGSFTGTSGITYGLNNNNTNSIGGNTGAAASATTADAVTTGFEIGIPLGLIGNSTSVEVLADINNNYPQNTYLSNQFLPGLPVGTGNLGTATFNFASTPGEYFTVSTPTTPNGIWTGTGGGNWSDSTKWSNAYVPSIAGDSASFASATSTSTITLNGSRTVTSLMFNSPTYSYTIAPGTGSLTFAANGATLPAIQNFGGSHTISAPVILSNNTTVSCASSSDTMSISGNISGSGSLSVSGEGGGPNVIISGNNSYGGGTTVNSGNLQLGSATALPTGTALTLSAQDVPAGVLDLNGNSANLSSITVTTGSHTGPTGATAQIINTSATAGTATLTYAGSNANPSIFNNGNIADNSGSGGGTTALTVASGSLTLEGNDTYGGNTTVNGGATLVLNSTGGTALPTGGNVVNNGSLVVSDPSGTVAAGNVSGSGTTTVNAGNGLSAINFAQAALVNNGDVTVAGTGTVGPISGSGTLTVNGTLQLATNSGGSAQGALNLGGSGVLDITNNHFTVTANGTSSSDPNFTAILGWLQDGQITSSSALPGYGVGMVDGNDGVLGSPVSSGQIEVAYTLDGDANLDGKVDITDFNIFAPNFGLPTTLGWEAGDFNYSGAVDIGDFNLFAGNFGLSDNGTDVSMPAADYAALDAFAAANGLSLTSVPEPASATMMVMVGLGILRRRRRSS